MIGMRPEVAQDLATEMMRAAGSTLTGNSWVPGPAGSIPGINFDMVCLPIFAGQCCCSADLHV